VGAARFAYNWGLARCLEAKERGKQIPSAVDLHKDWNKWKRENAPWWVNAPLRRHSGIWSGPSATGGRAGPTSPLQAQEGPGGQQGEVNPGHASARTRIGKVRTKERTNKLLELFQSGKARILSATISREADRWFVSLTCEVERPDSEPREVQGPEDVVGIDVGLKAFAALSDGTRIKPLEKALRLLKRRSKQLSRKQKKTVVERDPETGEERKRTVFSRNYAKAMLRFASPHPQHSPGLPAQGHHQAGESQAGSGGGGPERSAERESLAGHSGCGVGGLPADAGV
jgi:putative transposase